MKQETMYPTREEVIQTIQAWRDHAAADFNVRSIDLRGDSLRTFNITLDNDGMTMWVYATILPSQSTSGWYLTDPKLVNMSNRESVDDTPTVYSVHLADLMHLFPHDAIVSIDNEDSAYPEGHPVFGYGVIRDGHFLAFAQHPREEGIDYTYNPFLPHEGIVVDPNVMETLDDTEMPHIEEKWINDIKEWWA